LKNQQFILQKAGEREQKLRAVLKNCAGCALNDDEIESIVGRVSSHRQYTIALYDDPDSFVQAVRPDESDLPRPLREHRPMTVIARRDRAEDGETGRECVIHIYIPAKGEFSGEQGFQKTCRV